MTTIIKGGRIVNEGRKQEGCIVIQDGNITEIISEGQVSDWVNDPNHATCPPDVEVIDATGCYILPGVIDDHVHFREPGLTDKADIASESRAAAVGGVTTYFDMPNCVPQTTTLEALDDKFERAKDKSLVNYSFFYGATNDNADSFAQLDASRIPGVKLFMGSSTGNMLVDHRESLERIFKTCRLPLMAHCEDTVIINRNMAEAKGAWGDDPPVALHAMIRSEEACIASTQLAVTLAKKYGTRLHVAHVSTAEELELFTPQTSRRSPLTAQSLPLITAEACV